jgi:acyl-CoA thioesterase FadM
VTALAGPLTTPTVALRPRREGANIRTWIGFKHFMYLAEEAVLEWYRDRGAGPGTLFHRHGLELSIVDSSVQLPVVLDVDDVVDAEVTGGPDRFTVRLRARRDGAPTVLRGTVSVALLPADPGAGGGTAGPAGLPAEVAAATAPAYPAGRTDLPDTGLAAVPGAGGYVWSWRVPYYYCQFSGRIQHAGWVRALEEVVDRFLDERGISVGTLLRERGWIPVVSRARVTQLADVSMEETVHTVFTVVDVLKGVGFDARTDSYLRRDGALVHVATGRILHAYAIAAGPGAGGLATLDDRVAAALTRDWSG